MAVSSATVPRPGRFGREQQKDRRRGQGRRSPPHIMNTRGRCRSRCVALVRTRPVRLAIRAVKFGI